MSTSQLRPTLEEEKRRELVMKCLSECNVSEYHPDVVDTLTRWVAQESKAAIQDKRAELAAKGLSQESMSKLLMESLGFDSSSIDSRNLIRSILLEKSQSRISRGGLFQTAADFELAVDVVFERYKYISELVKRLGSYEKVSEYLKSLGRVQPDLNGFSINSILMNTFVSPTSRTVQPNGLCQLPSRVDLLTGGELVFPDFLLESDLANLGGLELALSPHPDTKHAEPSNDGPQLVLKKIRLKVE